MLGVVDGFQAFPDGYFEVRVKAYYTVEAVEFQLHVHAFDPVSAAWWYVVL